MYIHICPYIACASVPLHPDEIVASKPLLLREVFKAYTYGVDFANLDEILYKNILTYLPTYHSELQPWVSLGLLYNRSPQPVHAAIGMDPRLVVRFLNKINFTCSGC
jgi:hypothetical protein